MQINFFGDFKVDDIEKFSFGTSLFKVLHSSDINVVNLEAPVKVEGAFPLLKSGPVIHQHKDAPILLKKTGFNVISLANNHAMDWGKSSILYTKRLLGDMAIGVGEWDEAYKVRTLKVKGVRVGFMALTQHEFGVLSERCGHEHDYGTAWMLHPKVDEFILQAKKENDYLFVLPHAGIEHEYYPLPELRTLYRHYIDLGVDGVFASHPHTPQGWENYQGKPIFYSLGNFCFDNNRNKLPPFWAYGLAVKLFIDSGVDYEVVPIHYNMDLHSVDFTNDESIISHLAVINSILANKQEYLKCVNEYCIRLREYYDVAFSDSGYMKYNWKKYVKQLLRIILGRQHHFSPVFLMNNLQCEVHRWAILHALKNDNDKLSDYDKDN